MSIPRSAINRQREEDGMSTGDSKTGRVSNIQKFSLHDGPGIRDLIFFKGCPLHCLWCANPETQNYRPELSFIENRCIGCDECGLCERACPEGAIRKSAGGKIEIDRRLCTNCGECAKVCPAQSLRLLGEDMSVEDIVKVVEEDSAFHSRSGGGITISGGEPLVQAKFAAELLKECRDQGIDTAIETTGHARWEDVENVCQYANLIFYDIKHMDSSKHKAFTGVGNELILENIKRLARHFPKTPIIVRTPVVSGYNDSEDNIKATVDFLSEVKTVRRYELLPYHGFGESKYHQLGREYPLSGLKSPGKEHMAALNKIVEKLDRI